MGCHCLLRICSYTGSDGKESACSVGNLGLIPGLGRSPREGKGYPLQYSDLENSMDCIVHGVTKSQTQLSDFTFTFHFHALEKEMATHSSVLAWRIPGMVEPGGIFQARALERGAVAFSIYCWQLHETGRITSLSRRFSYVKWQNRHLPSEVAVKVK